MGQLLRMSPKVMKEIGSKFGSVPTQCSEAMFSKWLNHEEGTGHKERTWGTVLTALEDAGRGDVAISVLDKLTAKHKEGLCMNTTHLLSIIVALLTHGYTLKVLLNQLRGNFMIFPLQLSLQFVMLHEINAHVYYFADFLS